MNLTIIISCKKNYCQRMSSLLFINKTTLKGITNLHKGLLKINGNEQTDKCKTNRVFLKNLLEINPLKRLLNLNFYLSGIRIHFALNIEPYFVQTTLNFVTPP